MLDQIQERLLAPVHVVEDADDRRLGGDGLELLAERPGDLVAGRDQLLAGGQGTSRRGGDRVGLRRRELLQHLDDRPVGDALPVGQAAAAHDQGAVERADELRDEAGLAHPGRRPGS